MPTIHAKRNIVVCLSFDDDVEEAVNLCVTLRIRRWTHSATTIAPSPNALCKG